MKRILTTAAFAVALSGGLVFAQQVEHKHHQHDPHKVAMKIGHKLNLNADQTAKLEPVLAARQQKMAALKSDTTLTPDARRAQMHSIHQDTETQLGTILTADQMQQLKSMHHDHGHHDKAAATPAA